MEFLVGAKAQLKLDVITKVEQGKIPRKQARQILGKSERTLERYIASFRKEGVVFVRHGNQYQNLKWRALYLIPFVVLGSQDEEGKRGRMMPSFSSFYFVCEFFPKRRSFFLGLQRV